MNIESRKRNMERALVFSLLFIAVCVVTSRNNDRVFQLLMPPLTANVDGLEARFPIFTTPLTAKVHYLASGVHFKLKCQTEYYATYEWLRDGEFLMPQGDGNIKYNSLTGDLTLHNFHHEMGGEYICVATIRSASTMSQIQTVKESRLFRFKDDAKEYKATVQEFSYLRLPCGEINSSTNASASIDVGYDWYYGGMNRRVTIEDRHFIDKQGDLHFTYVKATDATSDDNMYVCVRSSRGLRVLFRGPARKVIVKTRDEPKGFSTIPMNMLNRGTTALLGSTARLECVFGGYNTGSKDHLPIIKWYDNADEIVNSSKFELTDGNRVLNIKHLTEEDEKTYYCQAFTVNGLSTRIGVYVNITSPPIWVQKSETVTPVAEDEDATFHCNARSMSGESEPSAPIWYCNAEPLDNNSFIAGYQISEDKKTLTLKNMETTDNICVQCMVKNSVGTSLMGDACVSVYTPLIVLNHPPYVQNIRKGAIVHLMTVAVNATHYEKLYKYYKWMFKNQTYISPRTPPFVVYNPISGQTYINTSDAEMSQKDYEGIEGVYTCRVYSVGTIEFVETEIILQDLKRKVNEKCQQTQRWKSCRENIMERLEDLERRMMQMEQKLKPKTSAEPAILTLTSQIKRLSSRLNGMCSFDDE